MVLIDNAQFSSVPSQYSLRGVCLSGCDYLRRKLYGEGAIILWSNCPEGNYQGGNHPAGNYLESNYPGAIFYRPTFKCYLLCTSVIFFQLFMYLSLLNVLNPFFSILIAYLLFIFIKHFLTLLQIRVINCLSLTTKVNLSQIKMLYVAI